jgi:hypothetical protein
MPDPSQPYREASAVNDEAPAHAVELKPYKVVGKSEWSDGYVVHLEASTIIMVRVSIATFHETAVGDNVFVRLEKAPPTPPGPGIGRAGGGVPVHMLTELREKGLR